MHDNQSVTNFIAEQTVSRTYGPRLSASLKAFIQDSVDDPPELALYEELTMARDFLGHFMEQYSLARDAYMQARADGAPDAEVAGKRVLFEVKGHELTEQIERVQKITLNALAAKNAMRSKVTPEEVAAIASRIVGVLSRTVEPGSTQDGLVRKFQQALYQDLEVRKLEQQQLLEGTTSTPIDDLVAQMDATVPPQPMNGLNGHSNGESNGKIPPGI